MLLLIELLFTQAVLTDPQSWLTSDKRGDWDMYLYSDHDCATAFKILKNSLPLPAAGVAKFLIRGFLFCPPFKKALAFISRMI